MSRPSDPGGGRPIESVRRDYAEKICRLAAVRSEGLIRGFATIAREDFVGPGPWQIAGAAELGPGLSTTPDTDPRRLYANVLVALDAERGLNNGEPAALARWLDCLDLEPGDRLLHVGCGVGYYTAIAAEAVGADGRVVGVELDPALAERARRNLLRWPNVSIVAGDGSRVATAKFDAVFVNAGATIPLPIWLEALAPGGRLLLPLTVGIPNRNHGVGHMLRVARAGASLDAGSGPDARTSERSGESSVEGERLSARFVSTVGIFHCAGARTDEGDALLRRAFAAGGHEDVRRLRRDAHARTPDCWLHGEDFCLSCRA